MKKQQVQQPSPSASPTDCIGLPYSPALLLDARLVPSLQNHPDFSPGCEWGFDGYFVFADHEKSYTGMQVKEEVVWEMLGGSADPSVATTLGWRVGFVLGWLSALAQAQYHEAQEGLHELMELLDGEQKCLPRSGHFSRSVDSAGWPLDM